MTDDPDESLRKAGRPSLTDQQAGDEAVRIINVALALKRGVSDVELIRRWGLTRFEANKLVLKRQRHPKVVALIGDSVDAIRQMAPACSATDALRPKKNLLKGAARLALALLEVNREMTLPQAVKEAARRVRVDHAVVKNYSATGPDKRTRAPYVVRTTPRRVVMPCFGRVDPVGVMREVKLLFSAWPKAKRRKVPGLD